MAVQRERGPMRPIILIFALSATAFGQTPPALDIVLLVEDSIPVTNLVSRTDLRTLGSHDRVAVMTFSGGQSLKLALDGDYGKEFRAIHKLDSKGTRSTTRLWDAAVKATELFDGPRDPSRRRVMFLVFSAEDTSSGQTVDTVRAALGSREVSLSAAAIPNVQVSAIPRLVPSPTHTPAPQSPTVLGERVPVDQGKVLPDTTLRSIEALALETNGLVQKNEWDFSKLAEHARSR